MEKAAPQSTIPRLVSTRDAAEILGRSAAALKRWRLEGIGPNWVELEGRVSNDVGVLRGYIVKNTRVASVRAAMEETRETLRKLKSKFYWYDFTGAASAIVAQPRKPRQLGPQS
jgi:hypothetical protein